MFLGGILQPILVFECQHLAVVVALSESWLKLNGPIYYLERIDGDRHSPVFDISWPRILLHRTWELSHLRTHHGVFVLSKFAHEKLSELGPLPETNMTSHLKIDFPKVKKK